MSSIRFFWIGEESEIFVAASRESFRLALREYGAECNASINASKMDAARDRVLELYDRAALSARASDAAKGEPVAYTSPDRLARIKKHSSHVDTMWGEALTNEGENVALYDRPAASGQKLTDEQADAIRCGMALLNREGTRTQVEALSALLRASDSATASDKEGAAS